MKKILMSVALTLSIALPAYAAEPGNQPDKSSAITSTLSVSIEKNLGNPVISDVLTKQMVQEVVPETVTTTSVSYVPESVPVTTYVPESVPVTTTTLTTDLVTSTTTWHPYYQKDPMLYSIWRSSSSTINASNYRSSISSGILRVPLTYPTDGFGGGAFTGYGNAIYLAGTNGYVPLGSTTFDTSVPVTKYVSEFTGQTEYAYVIEIPGGEKYAYQSIGSGGVGQTGSTLPVSMPQDGNSGGAISTATISQNPSTAVQSYRNNIETGSGNSADLNIHATRVTIPVVSTQSQAGHPLVDTTDLGWTTTNVVTSNEFSGTIVSQTTSTATNVAGPEQANSAYGVSTPTPDSSTPGAPAYSTVSSTVSTTTDQTQMVPTTTYTTESVPVTSTSSKTKLATLTVPVGQPGTYHQIREVKAVSYNLPTYPAYPPTYPASSVTSPVTSPVTKVTYGTPVSSKVIKVVTGSSHIVQKTVWKALPAPGAPTLARIHTGTSVSSFSSPISTVGSLVIASLLPYHARAVFLGQIGSKIPGSFRSGHIKSVPIHHPTIRSHA